MNEIAFKYYTAEGQAVDATLVMVKAEKSAHQDRVSALLQKYGADCLWGRSRSTPHAIGYVWEQPEDLRSKPPLRENFLKPELEKSGDITYACYKPDRRYKAGKAIRVELKAVGSFSFSDAISQSLKVDRNVFGIMNGRPVMCYTSAGLYNGKLVFRIPVGGDGKDFIAPEGFRELKKWEFIAITEEGE